MQLCPILIITSVQMFIVLLFLFALYTENSRLCKDLLSAAHKSRQTCNMSQQPNQRLLAQLSITWESIVVRGNQHTNLTGYVDDVLHPPKRGVVCYHGNVLYPNFHDNQVQQQMSWLQQQLSDQLPPSPEDIKATLTDVKQSGSSTKQMAADTLGENCRVNV